MNFFPFCFTVVEFFGEWAFLRVGYNSFVSENWYIDVMMVPFGFRWALYLLKMASGSLKKYSVSQSMIMSYFVVGRQVLASATLK